MYIVYDSHGRCVVIVRLLFYCTKRTLNKQTSVLNVVTDSSKSVYYIALAIKGKGCLLYWFWFWFAEFGKQFLYMIILKASKNKHPYTLRFHGKQWLIEQHWLPYSISIPYRLCTACLAGMFALHVCGLLSTDISGLIPYFEN